MCTNCRSWVPPWPSISRMRHYFMSLFLCFVIESTLRDRNNGLIRAFYHCLGFTLYFVTCFALDIRYYENQDFANSSTPYVHIPKARTINVLQLTADLPNSTSCTPVHPEGHPKKNQEWRGPVPWQASGLDHTLDTVYHFWCVSKVRDTRTVGYNARPIFETSNRRRRRFSLCPE